MLDKLDETLLAKLDLRESLRLLCTLPGGVGWSGPAAPAARVEAAEAERDGQVRRDLDLELEGRSKDAVGACTSTLNLAVAVTLVTWLPGVGVEQGEDPSLPGPWKFKENKN